MSESTKPRLNVRNRYVLAGDLIFIVVAVFMAFFVRLEMENFYVYINSALWMFGLALIIKPVTYYLFGLYRRMWVYASIQELQLIVSAVTSASVILSVFMISLFAFKVFVAFPRSVLVIDWLFSLIFVGGLRFILRLLAENKALASVTNRNIHARRVLIVGAGDAGALVVREMQKNPQINLVPVGFLDDDPTKLKHKLFGVPVVGKITDMARVLDHMHIDEVLIAIPSAPGAVVRRVADVCRLKGKPFKTMPGLYELLGGKVNVNRLREVDITDLLRREPAMIDDNLVGNCLSGRTVLVTGAGGSIGRELCRQIARWGPAELLLLGHGENSIFETLMELQDSYPALPMRPLIADVRDLPRLQSLFQQHRPQVLFHAAAHKHVPMMEVNVEDAISNNILGTRNVVETSLAFNIERLVMISTDKAIRPKNVMGATKRMAELIVTDAAERTGQSYSVVRFGNVLGSRGSVVPLFKRQIAQGGPVTVTHPDMRRYFMTIPEAVHLVLQAAAMGVGGEIFVLKMGQQVRILDLAEDLIRLSGLEPGRDVEIVFTGIRAGEKLSEDLWDEGFSFEQTAHPDIVRLYGQDVLCGDDLRQSVSELVKLAQEGDSPTAVQLMDEMIPGSAVRSAPAPDMTSID